MTESHIVVWIDRDDYDHLQRAYARLHITPSQVIRIATDRFLMDTDYRPQHPFAIDVAQPVEPERPWLIPQRPTQARNGRKVSFRIDPRRRDALRDILREPYSLGAFLRGALSGPGTVLQSDYIEERFRDLVGDADSVLRYWHDAPAGAVYDLDLLDAQVDMSKRRGAVLKRP